jgi:hypothetical protein
MGNGQRIGVGQYKIFRCPVAIPQGGWPPNRVHAAPPHKPRRRRKKPDHRRGGSQANVAADESGQEFRPIGQNKDGELDVKELTESHVRVGGAISRWPIASICRPSTFGITERRHAGPTPMSRFTMPMRTPNEDKHCDQGLLPAAPKR